MLYLFACVGPQCIKRSDSVRAFRFVNFDKNNYVQFASDQDYDYVVDRPDATLRTSMYADMYGMDELSDGDDSEDRFDDADDDEEIKGAAASQIDTTKSGANTQKFGALSFKPKLKEYLIDTCEEKQEDTLFYVRQLRRIIATQAQSKKKGDNSEEPQPGTVEMIEQLEQAFVALSFKNQINNKMADKLFR